MKIYIHQGEGHSFSIEDIKNLEDSFPSVTFTTSLAEAKDAEVALATLFFFTKDNLLKLNNLKFIQTLSAGYDVIDLDYLKKHGIRLANLRDAYSIAIAEDVVSKILFFNKNTRQYVTNMANHVWNREKEIHDIYHKNVLILGAGSIGKEIAKRLKSFDTSITGYDVVQHQVEFFDNIITTKEELEKAYSLADYVIVSLPLNKTTFHMINANVFDKMRSSALLINIARGPIIDEDALYKALKDKKIRGAAIDVVSEEPLIKTSKLWDLSNIYITPHVAFNGEYIKDKLMEIVKTNISNYLNNKPLINEIKL